MADTVYNVITKYDVDVSSGVSGFGAFAVVLNQVTDLLEKAKDKIAEAVGEIIHIGSEAEKTRLVMAGLFGATGLGTNKLADNLAMSDEMLVRMRKHAAELPGTFEDLAEIYQRALPGGAKAGQSAMGIEKLSADMMAVGKAFGLNAAIIGTEVAEIMEGRANKRMPLFAKLSQFMGPDMNANKFNALGEDKKWEMLNAALSKFSPMVKAYADTWDAISSTTESYVQNIIRVGSAGIFASLKEDLQAVNTWYEKNEASIMKVVSAIFDGLSNAFGIVGGFLREIIGLFADFVPGADSAADSIREIGTWIGYGADALITYIMVMGAAKLGTEAIAAAQWVWNAALGVGIAEVALMGVAIAALAAGLVLVIGYWEELVNSMTDALDMKPMRWLMKKAGFIPEGATDADIDESMGHHSRKALEGTYAHNKELSRVYGDDGVMGHLKGRLDAWGLLPSSPALAHANINNPMTQMQMMFPGMDLSQAGKPDVNGLLNRSGKPATVHNTSIGSINLYNNIYDAEDPARVIQHLTAKAIRDNATRPAQSASVATPHY